MLNKMFTQKDLDDALVMIEKCQKQREEINGEKLSKFNARNFLAFRNEFTQAQFEALLWEWGQ